MGYKTILVHCDAGKSVARRLDMAVGLAQRFGAHLVGLHVRRLFEPGVFFGGGFATEALYRSYDESIKANEAAAASAFARATAGKHQSFEFRVADGHAEDELAIQARYADLVIVGQAEPEPTVTPSHLPETVALAIGRPVLVVPHLGARPPGKTVMLCWNGSREAARAAAYSLSFLEAAEKVIVLVVDPRASAAGHGAGHGADPGAEVAAWLRHHDVKAVVQREVAPDSDVGKVILARAKDFDVDLIVMGMYGHSRLREVVLGGASRTILGSMPVPVLMAH